MNRREFLSAAAAASADSATSNPATTGSPIRRTALQFKGITLPP